MAEPSRERSETSGRGGPPRRGRATRAGGAGAIGPALGALLLAAAVGCGARYAGSTTPSAAGGKSIEAAGLPYQILDARTGHQVAEPAFWQALGGMRAVCVGEEHTNPHHHWVQLLVVRHLEGAWPHLALGMEMFQRPFQGVLDDYAAGRIDAEALRSRAGWGDRWGYDYNLYAPTIETVVAHHGALVALNAAVELTKQVAHHGLASLAPGDRAKIPELNLTDARHRAWFDALMAQMGGTAAHSKDAATTTPAHAAGGAGAADPKAAPPAATKAASAGAKPPADPKAAPATDPASNGEDAGDDGEGDGLTPQNIYTVQVIWDETMADTAARWLAAHPDDRMVILAGTGHCHDSAIVDRLKRRGVTSVVSLRTVIDDGQGSVAEALARPMNDYLVVLEPPPDVKAKLAAAE